NAVFEHKKKQYLRHIACLADGKAVNGRRFESFVWNTPLLICAKDTVGYHNIPEGITTIVLHTCNAGGGLQGTISTHCEPHSSMAVYMPTQHDKWMNTNRIKHLQKALCGAMCLYNIRGLSIATSFIPLPINTKFYHMSFVPFLIDTSVGSMALGSVN